MKRSKSPSESAMSEVRSRGWPASNRDLEARPTTRVGLRVQMMAKLTNKRIGGIRCNYTSASSISLVLSVFAALVCQICTGLEVVVVHGARYRQPVARRTEADFWLDKQQEEHDA